MQNVFIPKPEQVSLLPMIKGLIKEAGVFSAAISVFCLYIVLFVGLMG